MPDDPPNDDAALPALRRLPLRRILWGAFALPWQNRAAVTRATGLPLLAVIGCTLAWDVADFNDSGAARWTLDWVLGQVDRPHRSGTPLAEREQVQALLAESALDLFAARSAVYSVARFVASGEPADVETAMAKTLATEAVARVVDRAIQLTGGAAVVAGHPLERLYRRIRSWRIAEGTTEVLRLTIARGLLARRRGP